MFGELPKLFDRNFAIGFFLPVAVFFAASGLLLLPFDFADGLFKYLGSDVLIGTTLLGLLSWVGGIVLLAVNRDLYRFMEGYGKYNPLKLFAGFEVRQYRKLSGQLKPLEDQYWKDREEGRKEPDERRQLRNELRRRLVQEYPDKEEFVLPTPFGNVLRAFEVYSRVMYGLDSIPAWGRLLSVISKEYMELINGAKAQVDFWANLGVVFVLLQVEYVGLVYTFGARLNLWIVALFVVLGTLAPLRATSSAREWGDFVKSAFDMYAHRMRDELRLAPPCDRKQEKEQWAKFSRAIIYMRPEAMPELKGSGERHALEGEEKTKGE